VKFNRHNSISAPIVSKRRLCARLAAMMSLAADGTPFGQPLKLRALMEAPLGTSEPVALAAA